MLVAICVEDHVSPENIALLLLLSLIKITEIERLIDPSIRQPSNIKPEREKKKKREGSYTR